VGKGRQCGCGVEKGEVEARRLRTPRRTSAPRAAAEREGMGQDTRSCPTRGCMTMGFARFKGGGVSSPLEVPPT